MFVRDKPLQPSSVVARTYLSQASRLTNKHWTRLEILAWAKQANLLRTFDKYDCKKLHNTGPRLLRKFVNNAQKSLIKLGPGPNGIKVFVRKL